MTASNSSYFDIPTSAFDDDETMKQTVAKILSPVDASTLVPNAALSPPTEAPRTDTAQTTPQTGSLAVPPQQARPAVAGRAALPEDLVTGTQSSASAPSSGGLRTVVRDLNGKPAGSPPSLLPASRSQVQPVSNPYALPGPQDPQSRPMVAQPQRSGLAGAFQSQQQAYNTSAAPALYAASRMPVNADPSNPDPNASLRPGGTMPPLPALPAGVPQQVQAPSRLDLDQAELARKVSTGSGVSQIKRPWLRDLARVGDVAESIVLPAAAAWTPGTTMNHQREVANDQKIVGNDQAQQQAAAQLADTQSQMQERQALADKADRYDPNSTKTITTADGVMQFNPATAKFDQKIGEAPDKLNKYQIIPAGDGTMFRVDPSDPTHAEPITGPDGKQLTGKQESKYIQLQRGGEEHTIEIGSGGTQTDLGPTGQKPMHVSVNGGGTWSLDEDKSGKPILFNSKTGETKDAPDIQKAGTAAKAQAAVDKVNEPVDAAMNYANDYVTNGHFTGSGDEALQEKFFELAKPSVGFRMTQPQIDLLQNSRGWLNSAAAHLRHATKGTWFSDDQRQEIVQTMKDLAASKKKGGPSAAPGSPSSPSSGFNWKDHPKVQP